MSCKFFHLSAAYGASIHVCAAIKYNAYSYTHTYTYLNAHIYYIHAHL